MSDTEEKALAFLKALSLQVEEIKKCGKEDTYEHNSMKVPNAVKGPFRAWLLENHPDKGDAKINTSKTQQMNSNFDAFKKWFETQLNAPVHEARQRVELYASLKTLAETAMEKARTKWNQHRLEEAITAACDARERYETLKNEYNKGHMTIASRKLSKTFEELDQIEREAKQKLQKPVQPMEEASPASRSASSSASRSASDATTSVLQERILKLETEIRTLTASAATKQAQDFRRHDTRQQELETAKIKAEQEKQDLEKKVQVLEAAKLKSEQEKQVLEEDKLALQQQVQELLKKIQSAKALLSVQ